MAYTQNPGGPRQERTGGNIPTSFMSGPAQVDRDAIKKSLESLRIKKDKDEKDATNISNNKAAEIAKKKALKAANDKAIIDKRLQNQGKQVNDSINDVINKGEAYAANKFGNAGRAARSNNKDKLTTGYGEGMPIDGSETEVDTRVFKNVSKKMAEKATDGFSERYF